MDIQPTTRIMLTCLEIGGFGLILMIFSYLWRLRYEVEGYRRYKADDEKGIKKYMWILILLGTAFVFKLFLAAYYKGYEVDMNCFYAWSDMIFDGGIGNFYSSDAFTDYPPGYMMILYVVEAISRLFSIETASVVSRVMIKLVPILCDIGAGFIIWRLAKERFSEGSSCLLAGLYVISPAILMNSSVWGQTDSVFTLCVILVCYLCMKEKRIPAYFVFVLGVFIKPQMLMFAPVLIWTIIEQVFLKDFSWKKLVTDLIGGVCAIGSFFLAALPFGLGTVLNQYIETMGSYPYASVNAYNFWALMGKNWRDQNETFMFLPMHVWGTIVIIVAVILSAYVFFKLRKKDDKTRYFLSSAVVIGTMFLFCVRMHERYLFPIVALLLIAFVIRPARELYGTFVGFAFVHFLNVAHIYKSLTIEGYYSSGFVGFVSLLSIGIYGYMWFAMFRGGSTLPFVSELKATGRKTLQRFISVKDEDAKKPHEERRKFTISRTKELPKYSKTDWLVMLSIVLFYGTIAIVNLGDTKVPQTEMIIPAEHEVVVDMGEAKRVDMIYMYNGHFEGRRFQVDVSNDGVNYEGIGECKVDDVFKWNKLHRIDEDGDSYNLQNQYRYVRFKALDEARIREIVFLDDYNNVMTPVNAGDYPSLFDEQDRMEYPVTWRSGTYFDEIYHARTAQEMTEGAYNYENTHPPLGKFIMSIGIRLFGMNPFGWRIMGTLFGIGMLPILFAFARRLFDGRTWAAGVATALFAFDFMHFSQTRIATIDVYGTFFIIAMFFFMYWYSQMSFYDTPLKKTFVPLLGAAVSMGLGCASKWTAVYAAAGMAILFFSVIVRRCREYRLAKADPTGETAGIKHQFIMDVWMKYTFITFGVCVLLFIVLAGLIYLLSYLPFSNGQDMGLWDRMIKNQVDMYNYHSTLDATHPYSSVWYEWPLMIRPVFYYCGTTLEGLKEGISAFGNPLVWWAGVPAFIYMVYRMIRYNDTKARVLTFIYVLQLVPYLLISRCTFMYHYFPSVPFVVLMIVYTMVVLDKKEGKHWRKWIYVYTGAAVMLFFLFYPVISGMPVEGSYIQDGLKWMPDWTLYL